MIRWTWNIACLLSLTFAIALATLWLTSYRAHHRLGHVYHETRYTLHLDHGRLRLTAPSAMLRPNNPEMLKLARLFRNDQLSWYVNFSSNRPSLFSRAALPDTPLEQMLVVHPKLSRDGPLLTALERPEAFAAAHAYLSECDPSRSQITHWRDGILRGRWDGLEVELQATHSQQNVPCKIDLAQHTLIGNLWHDRLDVQLASMPFWPLTLPPLLLPAAWLRTILRQRRRRTLGLCPCCAYDLRATPTRCPECGHAPV